MLDIIIEVLRALILLGILIFFFRADKQIEHGRRGWLFIKFGFLLVLFGAFVDITDNFESLNWVVVLGDTPVQALLEKVVGYLGGFVLIAIGFSIWLPSIARVSELKNELMKSKRNLERQVLQRTAYLEKEIEGHRKADAALKLAEERRAMLYDHAPVSISHGLIGGDLIERNTAFAEMLGYESPEELAETARMKDDKFHIWKDPDDIQAMLGKLNADKLVRDFEARFRHKDGSTIWARLTFTTLADRNGKNYYFYCFAEDITDRKLATEALAESEKRLKTIMDSMPAGMYLVDAANRNIVDVNPAALKMTGYEYDDLVNVHCCLNLCPQEKDSCPILDEGSHVTNREGLIRRKDGTELPIIKTVAEISMDGRKYLLETFVDISEQKRLEQLKEDVDHIVRHDLKSPIIGVINACTLLLMEEKAVTGETREMLEIIQQQGNKVLRMIGMSLTIYKMEAGTYEYVPEQVDFMEVVQRVKGELEEAARNKGVSINVSMDGEESEAAFMVQGNELLYDSMFANLLKNAIEASPFGQTVNVQLGSKGQPVVRLVNSGAVPQEIRETFFEKYTSVGKTTGTGLGTYSANLVARTVGGKIEMDTSDEDETTTITVKLPDLA